MVRPPRTVRDVLGWVKRPHQILHRGAQSATIAPALTTAERQHIERVLGAGRIALCLAALAVLAWDPTWNGSAGQLPGVMVGGYALFGALEPAGAPSRRAVRLPSHFVTARPVVVRFSADPIRRVTVDNDGRPIESAGQVVIESSADQGVPSDILLRRHLRARSSKTA